MHEPVPEAPAPPALLYWATGGLLAGQVLAAAWPAPLVAWLAIAGALAAFALGRARAARPRGRGAVAARAVVAAPAGALAVAFVAAALGHWQLAAVLEPHFAADHVQRWAGARVEVRGVVSQRPQRRPSGARLVLELDGARRGGDWAPASGRLLVTVRQTGQPWQRGDGVVAIVALRRPRNFGNPGEFDYAAFLARRGIYVTGFAASDRGFRRTAALPGRWGAALEGWRDRVARCIEATIPPPAASIAAALLIGELSALEPAVRDRYARAGVSHVLSISGLHVGLVAASAYAAARWLLARSQRLLLHANVPKLALAGSLVPVLFYAAIVGANVATLRAEAMSALAVAGVLLDRPRDWLAPLAAAAGAICLVAPGSLFEISFQLSFAAVLALVLGVPRLTRWWTDWEAARLIHLRPAQWRWRALRWLVLGQAVTVCALLATAPLTAWHFNQVSIIALIANPLIVPLLGMATVGLGLAGTAAVAVAPPLAVPLFHLVGLVVRAADVLVAWCARLPGASLQVATPSLVEIAAVYGLLGFAVLARGRARRSGLALCGLALAASVAGGAALRHADRTLRITMLSVGQGDCALVEFPGGHVMLIDGGGLASDFDVGRHVVGPALWRRRITRIDTLVLSHADHDHYGGFLFLARHFSPAALWWSGAPGHGARFAELERALADAGVARHVLAAGARRRIGGVRIEVLHPPRGARGEANDRSLTLRLRYGGTSVLFAGDLEAAGEAALVAAHGRAAASTVLKVPHHGSRSSSSAALLDAVRPRLAVMSLGYDNRFGFPHSSVLAAYRARGIALWRTDLDGAVTLRIAADGTLSVDATRARERGEAP